MASELYQYTCPIRGTIQSREREEKYLIECLRFLIDKKRVPKEHIAIKRELQKIGAGGKNRLIPDILVFDKPYSSIENSPSQDIRNSVVYVCEIKVDGKAKKSALDHQLFPAMRLCPNLQWGIYWDKSSNLCYSPQTDEFSIAHLPTYGMGAVQNFKRDDLLQLLRGDDMWERIDLALRNNQGGSKEKRHKEVFKLLLSKYYDEVANKDDLQFRIAKSTPKQIVKRIRDLYKKAKQHYRLTGEFQNIVADDIGLNEEALRSCVSILEAYSLINTDRSVIQEFYMNFAPSFLKQDLQQYFTPKEIVDFMVGDVEITNVTNAIDPCSGSGDFMVGLLRRAKQENKSIDNNLYCWDLNSEAATLANINMILNGDGRSNVKVLNSLDEHSKDNDSYDFVITNPPFGKRSVYRGKSRKKYKIKSDQTGMLFIERGLNLLNENGILISVIPAGYMENPSDNQFRKVILKKSRLLGIVSMPNGCFKASGAGGRVSVIYLQKMTPPKDYNLFTLVANKVGFDLTKKTTPPLYKRELKTGAYIQTSLGNPATDNDLITISRQIRSFAKDEGIQNLIKSTTSDREDYDSIALSDIASNEYILNAKLYARNTEYIEVVEEIKKRDYFKLGDHPDIVEMSNRDKAFEKSKKDSQSYKYIETGDVYADNVSDYSSHYGWDLPGRAKQLAEEGDIFISKMDGSEGNFFMVPSTYSGYVVSNGFWKIRIDDQQKRLSFYKFLFSREFAVQMNALSTGSIMGDVKESDLLNMLYIPIVDPSEEANIENLLKMKSAYMKAQLEYKGKVKV